MPRFHPEGDFWVFATPEGVFLNQQGYLTPKLDDTLITTEIPTNMPDDFYDTLDTSIDYIPLKVGRKITLKKYT